MAQDPYRYFRVEARELSEQLGQGILDLQKEPYDTELIVRLLRYAHTLKGAARVVKQLSIAEASHALEDHLERQRERATVAADDDARSMLALVDAIAEHLLKLDAPNNPAPKPVAPALPSVPPSQERAARADLPAAQPTPPAEDAQRTVRVAIEDLDVLLRGVVESTVRLGALKKDLGSVEELLTQQAALTGLLESRASESLGSDAVLRGRARPLLATLSADLEKLRRSLSANLSRAESELTELQGMAQELRLVQAQTLFPALQRATYDAAQALGRRAELVTSGGDVRLDAHVLAVLKNALLHVVRNGVAHGIELPSERLGVGKPELGTLRLSVERRASRVAFRVSDDGRGIDVESVRRAAVAQGVLSAEAARATTPDALMRSLLTPGFSTSAGVDEISGRGIGLDMVRATVEELKGELAIASTPGQGTTLTLEVPVSVAAVAALHVVVGGEVHAIPLDSVRSALRVSQQELTRSEDREAVNHEGRVIPFLPLERALGSRGGEAVRPRGVWSAIVVGTGERVAALGVDRVLGTGLVVVRALPERVEADAVVAGAALDAAGDPVLVLDPRELVAAAERHRGGPAPGERPARLPILVIDDSLTTRMLEQSILESAGYEVELAVCAEDGLELAAKRRYGLFVVDVDMPGMSGFDFVARTRADPELRNTPAILVTSRDSAEDKRRGAEVGARAYVVKGEFEQGQLLGLISTLLD